MLLDYT